MEKIMINRKQKNKYLIVSTIGLIIYLISFIIYIINNVKEYNIPFIVIMSLFFIVLFIALFKIIRQGKNMISEDEMEKGYKRANGVGLITGIVGSIAFYIKLVLVFLDYSTNYLSLFLMFIMSCGAFIYYVGINNIYRSIKHIRNRKANVK